MYIYIDVYLSIYLSYTYAYIYLKRVKTEEWFVFVFSTGESKLPYETLPQTQLYRVNLDSSNIHYFNYCMTDKCLCMSLQIL